MKRRRFSRVAHPAGLKPDQLQRRATKPRPHGAVTAVELEADVLAFHRRTLWPAVETAQLGLANVAHKLIVAHLRVVAQTTKAPAGP